MKSFKQFTEEVTNCTGAAIAGTDPADTSSPKASFLGQKKIIKRKKPPTAPE